MWDAADLAALIDPDLPGYALATRADLSTFGVLFRNPAAETFGIGGNNPSALCVQTSAPARNALIVINAVTYKVTRPEPDGKGFTRLQLEQQ